MEVVITNKEIKLAILKRIWTTNNSNTYLWDFPEVDRLWSSSVLLLSRYRADIVNTNKQHTRDELWIKQATNDNTSIIDGHQIDRGDTRKTGLQEVLVILKRTLQYYKNILKVFFLLVDVEIFLSCSSTTQLK